MAESISLDRLITDTTDGVTITFDGEDTDIVIPYIAEVGSDFAIVRTDTNAVLVSELCHIDEATGETTLVVPGVNLIGIPLKMGIPYATVLVLSTIYPRNRETGKPAIGGRLNLRYVKIHYENTRSFTVGVTAQGRPERLYPFTSATPVDGIFSVPVLAQNVGSVIRIYTTAPLDLNISGYEWEGVYYTRVSARR